MFKPSPQQQNFFNWITDDHGSCILEAVAGSGKTTTLIEGLKLMRGDIFFGAYNKKIAEEIKEKAPQKPGLNISTMHAAGFSIWRRFASRVRVDENKCKDIWKEANPKGENAEIQQAVLQLVSLAKQAAFGATFNPTDHDWFGLIDHFGIEFGDHPSSEVIAWAKKIFAASVILNTSIIDFDDMIFAPLYHKVKAKEYDWVLIDEAQDTNASRRALSLLLLKRGGRLVAVGDPHQAIYGFTGADADSLDKIGEAVSAIRIPLSVSFRCPQKVTEFARTFVQHIQSTDSAPMGLVESLKTNEELYQKATQGDAIVCRFNAPIISAVYKFIAQGVPAKVEGREIGTGLKTLVRRWKVKKADALIYKIDAWTEKEVARFRIQEKESKAVAVEDKSTCLKVIINRCLELNPQVTDIVEAVCSEIDNLFGDNILGNFLRLMSIHKSKGLEFKRVFWLQAGPAKWARKDWEQIQEQNLNYVACTRAQFELYLVPMPPKGDK